MKKKILAIALFVVSITTSAFATEQKGGAEVSFKSIEITEPFEKLEVSGNVEVILYEDNSNIMSVMASKNRFSKFHHSQKDGVLSIEVNANDNEVTLVYLPVKNLREIVASDKSKITSATVLNSSALTLALNGDCKIDVKTTGLIEIVEGEQCEVVIEKRTTRKSNKV